MKITSPAFEFGATIPEKFSRDGGNEIPPLVIEDVPENTASLALVVDDPDAPRGTFTHWIIFNLPGRAQTIEGGKLPEEARQGLNDWDQANYGGPRPPDGEHRYYFHLYALDTVLTLANGAKRDDFERAIETHVLTNAEWMGRFAPLATA